MPWTKLYKINTIAPEFYTAPVIQKSVRSVWGEIWKFLTAKSNNEWLKDNGDFAGRSRFTEYTTKVWPSRMDGSSA